MEEKKEILKQVYESMLKQKNIIQQKITEVLKKMYNKDVCFKLTLKKTIESPVKDCGSLSKEDAVLSTLTLIGHNKEAFDMRFEIN